MTCKKNILKHFKRLFSFLGLFFLFSICSFAQEIHSNKTVKKPTLVAKLSDDSVRPLLELDPISKNAWTLYEKTHLVTLTSVQFEGIMYTSAINMANWEKVLEQYKNDSTVDLHFIRQVVNGMKEKLKFID